MATLTRPGVYVDLSSFPTYASTTPGTAAACFVGSAPRGPLTPTFVTSWKNFTQYYGGFETAYPPSSLHLAVFSYFSAGGTTATIIRAYRTDTQGPTTASSIFDDQATPDPQPSLQISAANPGQWGNNVYIDILPGSIPNPLTPSIPLSFSIQVKYQGTAPVNVVERWMDVSMVPGSTNAGQNNYAPDVINNPYSGSNFITVADQSILNATPTPAPANNPAKTSASQALGTGGAGQPGSDGGQIPLTDIQTAVQLLDSYPDQPFVLNLPGISDSTTLGPVIGYAQNRGDVFLVVDPVPNTSDPITVVAQAQGLGATAQAAFYYPQVQISDPYSVVPGVTRLIPPGGFVVGQYISTDMSRGVAKAPAGLGASLLGVTGLEFTLSNDTQGILTQGNVNCIISVPGSGVVIWGARTLSPYLVTRYVPVERTLIYLQTELVALCKFAVFEPNDWVLWNQITSVVSQFLTAFWQSGGLQGQSADEAFYITCDGTVNTAMTIQQGIVTVEVGVALQYPAEFVIISIGQWAGGQSVSTSTS
jgi:phage tail sheath protein FI